MKLAALFVQVTIAINFDKGCLFSWFSFEISKANHPYLAGL